MPQLRCASPVGRWVVVLLLCASIPWLGSCTTVDTGPPAGVAPPCIPDETFFAERVLPELLDKYNCRAKEPGGCHDAQTGLNKTFSIFDTSQELFIPGAGLPENMQKTYESAIVQVDCGDPTQSPILTGPDGVRQPPHGGGKLFDAVGSDGAPSPEVQLVVDWLSQ